MKKMMLGFSLVLSSSLGICVYILAGFEYIFSAAFDFRPAYHQNWLVTNFFRQFHMSYLLILLICIWGIGLYIMIKECYFNK